MPNDEYYIDNGVETLESISKPRELKEKPQKSGWKYGKMLLIVVIVIALIAGTFIYSMVTQGKADYTVALITSYSMPDEGARMLQECIAGCADDRNGDGKIQVRVISYVFSENEDELHLTDMAIEQLSEDITEATSSIFMYDTAGLELAFATTDLQSCLNTENALSWEEFKVFSEFVPVTVENDLWSSDDYLALYEELDIALRDSDASQEEYFEASSNLYEKLKIGEISEG